MTATVRPLPPPLQVQYPLCGICGNETSHDGEHWQCENCKAFWRADGTEGERAGNWDYPDAERCPSIDGRYLTGGCWSRNSYDATLRQCLLDAGHTGDHHWNSAESYSYCWTDLQAATEAQLSQREVELKAAGR